MQLRNELGTTFADETFAALYPRRGQPASLTTALTPIRPKPATRIVFSTHLAGRLANTPRSPSIIRSAMLGLVASRSSRNYV